MTIELILIAASAITGIGGAFSLITKWITGSISRDVADVARDVVAANKRIDSQDHRAKNILGRLDGVEHLRSKDIERIVRLETSVQAIEKSIEEIKAGQVKLGDTITDRFDKLDVRIKR